MSGPDPTDALRIEANALSDPEDLKTAISCIETLREIGSSAELRPFVAREVMPGDLRDAELETYLRDAVTTYWHECGAAKMGRDTNSVVDGRLKVYGIDGLRVADASISPASPPPTPWPLASSSVSAPPNSSKPHTESDSWHESSGGGLVAARHPCGVGK